MVISQQNRQNKPEFEWIITWQFLWIEDSMNNNIANYHGSMTGGKADTGCFMSFFLLQWKVHGRFMRWHFGNIENDRN